jgi:hypothetical protein
MKQHIRELLSRSATGIRPEPRDGSRDYRGLCNGDTYERYTKRCKAIDIDPRGFQEWLAFELSASKPGRHLYLDDHQRFGAASQAG